MVNINSKKNYIIYSLTLFIFFVLINKVESKRLRGLRGLEEDRLCIDGYFYSKEAGKCFRNAHLRVLLIRDKKADNTVYNLLSSLPFIEKIVVNDVHDVPKYTKGFLSIFDCVLYDTFDSGFNIKIENEDEIEYYIKNGGAFLVTHDRWDEDYGPIKLFDSERENTINYSESISRKAKVSEFGHPLFTSYYDLTHWTVIDIAETHKTYHKIINRNNNTVKVLMELVVQKEKGIKYDYLLANEVGKGRIVYWAAGHSNTISKDEQKLFLNIVSWLVKLSERK